MTQFSNFKSDLESLHKIISSIEDVNIRVQLTTALEEFEVKLEKDVSQHLANFIVKLWKSEAIKDEEYEAFIYVAFANKKISIEDITQILKCSRATAYRKFKERRLSVNDLTKLSLSWKYKND
ncbi:hypothetical protein [Anaerorhabdus sp.]|uniref:hypothetical protein n=1 Tax=Anaerorhabdus sp. TaxID=1872524 RepID=UPI002FCC7C91